MTDNTTAAPATPENQDTGSTYAAEITPMTAEEGAAALGKMREEKAKKAAAEEGKTEGDDEGNTPETAKKKSKAKPEEEEDQGAKTGDDGEADEGDSKDKKKPDETDEDDSETDDDVEDGADDEEDDAEDNVTEEAVEIKINGKIEKVTYADLIDGYSKSKGVEKRLEQVTQKEQAQTAREAKMMQQHDAVMNDVVGLGRELLKHVEKDERYSEETMNRLRTEDPTEWSARKLELSEKRELAARAQGIEQQRKQQEAQQKQEEFGKFAQAEAKKLEQIWADSKTPEERGARVEKVARYLEGQGFSQDEIKTMVRADLWSIADKAMRYDAGEKGFKDLTKQIRKAPKMHKPGAKSAERGEISSLQRQLENKQAELRKTGDHRIGAEVLGLQRKLNALKQQRKGA